MLNKLLKHEFRATGRIMLPTLIGLLVMSIMAGISLRIMSGQARIFWVFQVIMGLLQGAFFAGLFAVCILVIVLIVIRFYKSLMGNEGYLSFTLPVTVDGHLWSKLITSFVWMVAVVLACLISIGVFLCIGGTNVTELMPNFVSFFQNCCADYGILNTIGFVLEGIIAVVLAGFSESLHFYAAIAIGASASRSKKLLSVVFYFVLAVGRNSLALLTVPILSSRTLWNYLSLHYPFESTAAAIPAAHVIFTAICFALAVLCALYYFIARFYMTKRLNLA